MCALLLPIISEGVIGIKPRGDTREEQRTIRFLRYRTKIRTGKGEFFSALKSSGGGSIFMKSRG